MSDITEAIRELINEVIESNDLVSEHSDILLSEDNVTQLIDDNLDARNIVTEDDIERHVDDALESKDVVTEDRVEEMITSNLDDFVMKSDLDDAITDTIGRDPSIQEEIERMVDARVQHAMRAIMHTAVDAVITRSFDGTHI